MTQKFELVSSYKPGWDQPEAIEKIVKGFKNWKRNQTLLGATGTWKTFTMANIVQQLQKPTLVISHNKTLAAQLATEFKYFFPKNAVHYFVSYFDYYQPESYLPEKDMYVEKQSTINQEIEMYRLATMASLISRPDTLIVSSVSALYGLWSKDEFAKRMLKMQVWEKYDFDELKRQLIAMQYQPSSWKIEQWMFDFKGEMVDIFSSTENEFFRLIFNYDVLEMILVKDPLTWEDKWSQTKLTLWPATQFLQKMDELEPILNAIKNELEMVYKEYNEAGKIVEAERIYKRTNYDIRMIKETGFTNWIENYSFYFDKRAPWTPPDTIFDYFPDDMLCIVDESHMSLPQLRAMPAWDKSRKSVLIQHGFRLPSAVEHRPINFQELETIVGWNDHSKNLKLWAKKIKKNSKSLFVSATPAPYELNLSSQVVEQVIRPTWLLDPITYIYPKWWDYQHLEKSLNKLLEKKGFLKPYLENYDDWLVKQVFADKTKDEI